MHDLERDIEKWRQSLARELDSHAPILNELETHLRSRLDELAAAGITGEAAFQQAVKELGDARLLGAEFAKVGFKNWAPIWIIAALTGCGALLNSGWLWHLAQPSSATDYAWLAITAPSQMVLPLTAGGAALAGCYIVRRLFGELPLGQARAAGMAIKIIFTALAIWSCAGPFLRPLNELLAPQAIHQMWAQMRAHGLHAQTIFPGWLVRALGILIAVVQFVPRLSLRTRAAVAFLIPLFMQFQALVMVLDFDMQMRSRPVNFLCAAVAGLILSGLAVLIAPEGVLKRWLRGAANKTLEWTA